MLKMMTDKWWVLLLRGIIAIVLGLVLLFWPDVSVQLLVLLVGIYAILHGTLTLFTAIAHRKDASNWWAVAIEGLLGIALGILVFVAPQFTAVLIVWTVGGWAILTGLFQIIAAWQLRKETTGEIWTILGGIVWIIFGVAVIINPVAGAWMLTLIIALSALVIGVITIITAFRVRKLNQALTQPA